jgi:histidinol dehydrogenase
LVSAVEISGADMRSAFLALPSGQRDALEIATARVRAYHERQKLASWSYCEPDGSELGQQVTPLDRVGLYVPGGKAAYPSSVLMNAIPARVAGVSEIVMVVPAPDGVRNPLVLAAAHLAGVSRVFTIGGAQAVAALAYGTATIPAVDKICGPGNAYVAAATRRVFGVVGSAGRRRVGVLIIADASAHPDWWRWISPKPSMIRWRSRCCCPPMWRFSTRSQRARNDRSPTCRGGRSSARHSRTAVR